MHDYLVRALSIKQNHKSEERLNKRKIEIKKLGNCLLGQITAMVVPDNLPYDLVVLHRCPKVLGFSFGGVVSRCDGCRFTAEGENWRRRCELRREGSAVASDGVGFT